MPSALVARKGIAELRTRSKSSVDQVANRAHKRRSSFVDYQRTDSAPFGRDCNIALPIRSPVVALCVSWDTLPPEPPIFSRPRAIMISKICIACRPLLCIFRMNNQAEQHVSKSQISYNRRVDPFGSLGITRGM